MGNDVIDYSCFDIASAFQTADTQRMRLEVDGSGFLPSASITFFLCGLSIVAMQRLVFLAVHSTVWNQPPAAGMLAWCVWSARHNHTSHGSPGLPKWP